MEILLFFLFSIIMIEGLLFFYLKIKKKTFQWILFKKDIFPDFSQKLVKKYFKLSFSKNLGWDRKPNTVGSDMTQSGLKKFSINKNGERSTPGFNKKNGKIAVYGDSFAFCRLVGDKETWPYHLSRLLNEKVSNFGVGNYGIDQSLLKLKLKNYPSTCKIVIIAIVPETIVRIKSQWKHFFEYGNILAFKPIFRLHKNNLELINLPIKNENDFYNNRAIIHKLKKEDIFYNKKFQKDVLHFPYCITIFKNFLRNVKLLAYLVLYDISRKNPKYKKKAFNVIIDENHKFQNMLYKDKETVLLLKKIVSEFSIFSKRNKKNPILLIIPQKKDLEDFQNKKLIYDKIYSSFSNILPIIDLMPLFIENEHKLNLYANGDLGDHTSNEMNIQIADYIYNFLKTKNYL